jgi:L-malate glycosyltransferase
MEINQILPSITTGDAVSNECLRMQEILVSNGFKSSIYAENIDPQLTSKAINYKKYRDAKDKILIFHYSIGSTITDFVRSLKCQKVMRYHNVTPYKYFTDYNGQLAYLCKKGRDDIRMMKDGFFESIADSEFNKKELIEQGYKNVEVLPILLDFHKYAAASVNKKLMNKLSDATNIVFVGKIAPHKAQKELVKIFYYYQKYINHDSRLLLIGSYSGFEKYYYELLEMIKKLQVKNVMITGKISLGDLVSYYKCADLFLCASEHEGFCVPLAESMFFRVPIVAYNSTAIPYTLGGSGVMFNHKHAYIEIAEMINVILSDKTLANKIVLGQTGRMAEFSKRSTEENFKIMIDHIVDRTRCNY